jgi:hypothetical protein
MPDADGFTTVSERRWRFSRIEQFTARQRRDREWINFGEVADWCAREAGSIVPDESKRAKAFDSLAKDLLDGEFEIGGKSQVLFLFPGLVAKARMTREYIRSVIEDNLDGKSGQLGYLPYCWARRGLVELWFKRHRLGSLPPRFEPWLRSHRLPARHQGGPPPRRGLCSPIMPNMPPAAMRKQLPAFLKELSAKAEASGERFNQVVAQEKAEIEFGKRIDRPTFRHIYEESGVKRRQGRPRKSRQINSAKT